MTSRLPQSRRLRETRRDSSLREGAKKEEGIKNARAPLHGVRAVTAERQSREQAYYSTGGGELSRGGAGDG